MHVQGDKHAAREVSDRLLQMGAALGGLLALSYAAAAPVIPGLFSTDEEVSCIGIDT